jgi:hypothetical protein
MRKFLHLMVSPVGRAIRGLLGTAMIVLGLLLVGGGWGWIVALVGLIPLGGGLLDGVIVAPLFGLPFVGSKLRKEIRQGEEGEKEAKKVEGTDKEGESDSRG